MTKEACIRVVDDEVWFDPSSLEDKDGYNQSDHEFQYKLKAFLGYDYNTRVAIEAAFGGSVPKDHDYTESLKKEINRAKFDTGGKKLQFTSGDPRVVEWIKVSDLPEGIQDQLKNRQFYIKEYEGEKVVELYSMRCFVEYGKGFNDFCDQIRSKIIHDVVSNGSKNDHWTDKIANSNVFLVD
jgi:hypothetical protein